MNKKIEERIEQLENEVKELKKYLSCKIRKVVGIGDTFKLAGIEWKVLDIMDDSYFCITTERYGSDKKFSVYNNNWYVSKLREELNKDLFEKLADEIGKDNIIPFKRDLLSLDGQDEYGYCTDMVSLLTVDEYRKYRKLLPNTEYWWWLCTPWSTTRNGYEASVTVVSPRGDINGDGCNNYFGVRPFCIFSSAIFESEE